MLRIGVIGGTSADMPLVDPRQESFATPYGILSATLGTLEAAPEREVVFVQRHGAGHARLSSSVDHRANIWGLKEAGVAAIVGTTVCGILDPRVDLARPIVFDDLFFADNRLPDGSPCTFFDAPGQPGRGHFIFADPFSPSLRDAAVSAARMADLSPIEGGTYACSLGPRFNTRAEIAWFRSVGACAVSQTAGPEAVLSGELELPYCLVGFGVDFANGVCAEPTPLETLDANIAISPSAFAAIVGGIVRDWTPPDAFDTGFVYRFD